MRSVVWWTGRSSGRQLLYPGSFNPGRWTAADTLRGHRLVPYYFSHGPSGEDVRANLPDEYVYAQRVFVLDQMPEGLDGTARWRRCRVLRPGSPCCLPRRVGRVGVCGYGSARVSYVCKLSIRV